ncbi:3,4-dihydroxy-2-butanone-4-phosphate synthase [Candidatus Endobugula sertula]|uniref:3,4-dihydroxy-2-butanone 4-phosphate synthase n=1 Tax=Candidatus Endobugula sertula TaxID=62101 RepID=A0A1D2QRS9_9GAMM|nr:3,4-dihydroxy-2-butanone-4-phosphate synthase [Candidatus Endobugula sertula]
MKLNTTEELIDDIRQGKMVVLMDDEHRENEGDLVMAAEQVRPDDINFMATHARGLVCLTLTEQRCQLLDLPLMVRDNRERHSTNFTVSIEAADGVTTGISAADRAKTIRAAVARDADRYSIVQPGHVFPLMAQPGGVLSRAGHTEAGCDLARLSGYEPAAAIVEIMNEDGTMARHPDLEIFAKKHHLKIGTIADLIHYRSVTEKTVECINHREINTRFGRFSLATYRDVACGDIHFALTKGEVVTDEPILVRVHLLDTARDLLSIEKESANFKSWTFHDAMTYVAKEGRGIVVLMCYGETSSDIEHRIESMVTGLHIPVSQDTTYRQVGTGAQILRDLGIHKMRLMSAPLRFSALSGFDLEVVEVISSPKKE